MRNGNATLFRRCAAAETLMLTATMPKTAALDIATNAAGRTVITIANRGNTRLVKLAPRLTATMTERMAA